MSVHYLNVITGTDPQLSVFGIAAVVLGVPFANVGGPMFAIREVRMRMRTERVRFVMCRMLVLLVVYCRGVVAIKVFLVGVQFPSPIDAAFPLQGSRGWCQWLSFIVCRPGCRRCRCWVQLQLELARWGGLRCGRCNYDRIVDGYL